MKKLQQALLISAASVVMVGSAVAADLAVKAAPLPLIGGWQGGYLGVHGGAGAQHSDCFLRLTGTGDPGGCATNDSGYGSTDAMARSVGAVFGAQAGYDWQNRSFVYGVAADWSATSLKGHNDGGASGSLTYEAKVNWLASFRGRAGLAVENTLLYVTGGLALINLTQTWNDASGQLAKVRDTGYGWVAGVGVEHKFSGNWSVVAEFLHYEFDKIERNALPLTYTTSVNTYNTINVARVGLNYRY